MRRGLYTAPRAPSGPLDLTGAGHAANPTIDAAGLAGAGGSPPDGPAASAVTFPPAETSVAASFATVPFQPSMTAMHVPTGGRLALRAAADVQGDPRAQGAPAYEGSSGGASGPPPLRMAVLLAGGRRSAG